MNREFTVHYAPGEGPLCGSDCPDGALTDNPDDVTGCADCLELAAEDLADDNELGRPFLEENKTRDKTILSRV